MNNNIEGNAIPKRTEAMERFQRGLAELRAICSQSEFEHAREIRVQFTVVGFARSARLGGAFIHSPDHLRDLRRALHQITEHFHTYRERRHARGELLK